MELKKWIQEKVEEICPKCNQKKFYVAETSFIFGKAFPPCFLQTCGNCGYMNTFASRWILKEEGYTNSPAPEEIYIGHPVSLFEYRREFRREDERSENGN